MKADDVKRLKELEKENGQLKELVAERSSRTSRSRRSPGKLLSPARRRKAVAHAGGPPRRSPSVGRAGSPASTAPPSATARRWPKRRALRRRCASSRPRSPAGATAAPTATCCTRGLELNRKRVQRLWREEGLRVPARKRKRAGVSATPMPCQAAHGHASQPRLGARLPARRDRRRARAEAAQRRRRVHPRGAGDRGRALDHRRPDRRYSRSPRPGARRLPRVRPHGQRPRAHRPLPCAAGASSPAPAPRPPTLIVGRPRNRVRSVGR